MRPKANSSKNARLSQIVLRESIQEQSKCRAGVNVVNTPSFLNSLGLRILELDMMRLPSRGIHLSKVSKGQPQGRMTEQKRYLMKFGKYFGMAAVLFSLSVNSFAQKQVQGGPPPKLERMPEALENRFALSAAPS